MTNGTNPLMLLDELRSLGDAKVTAQTDQIPSLDELDASQCHLGWQVELRGDASRADIEDVFIFVMDDMTLDIVPIEADDADETQAEAAPIAWCRRSSISSPTASSPAPSPSTSACM